jgi:NTP pyrophosphatase (non-canonical NTP hydrolase)
MTNKPINSVNREDVKRFLMSTEYGNVLDDYQTLAVRSAIYPGKGTPFGLMYAALGLAEAGEVQNKVKKIFRDDGAIHLEENGLGVYYAVFTAVSEERKQQIRKELGGVLWYIAACCDELGIKLSDIARVNLVELASRAERGTLQGSGDNR